MESANNCAFFELFLAKICIIENKFVLLHAFSAKEPRQSVTRPSRVPDANQRIVCGRGAEAIVCFISQHDIR